MDIDDNEKVACVDIVKYFHVSTQTLSEKFYSKLQRYNYVTPTSYLQAISGFKMLITSKQNEIMAAKKRYVKGLDQLAFAENQVERQPMPSFVFVSTDTIGRQNAYGTRSVAAAATGECQTNHGDVSRHRDSIETSRRNPRNSRGRRGSRQCQSDRRQ